MKSLLIKTFNNSYPLFIGKGLFQNLPEIVKKQKVPENIFLVVDKIFYSYFKKEVDLIKNEFNKSKLLLFTSTEKNKSSESVEKIHSELLKNEFGRDSTLLAIGGGILGDTAGFAASTFMRGISLIHIPTTLLAAVDSSIGGKTGINFQKKKNLIGTFYQPSFILIDTNHFNTLNEREIVCGVGEIIKYSFMKDEIFFNFVNKNLNNILNLNILEKIILSSASIKAQVVNQDEKEKSLRKILNLGHTFAHAIESSFNYKIKHGEAVIAGLISAVYLSKRLNLFNEENTNKFISVLTKVKIPKLIKTINNEEIFLLMLSDKKNKNRKINFVLPGGIGKLYIDVQTDKENIFYALNKMKEII